VAYQLDCRGGHDQVACRSIVFAIFLAAAVINSSPESDDIFTLSACIRPMCRISLLLLCGHDETRLPSVDSNNYIKLMLKGRSQVWVCGLA